MAIASVTRLGTHYAFVIASAQDVRNSVQADHDGKMVISFMYTQLTKLNHI